MPTNTESNKAHDTDELLVTNPRSLISADGGAWSSCTRQALGNVEVSWCPYFAGARTRLVTTHG